MTNIFFLLIVGRKWFERTSKALIFPLISLSSFGWMWNRQRQLLFLVVFKVQRGPIWTWGNPLIGPFLISSPTKRLCSSFDGCLVPFHEFLFSRLRFRLPFNDFEVEVLNHLRITPSQLHLVARAFMKVFEYWCDYQCGVSTLQLFFNVRHTFYITQRGKCCFFFVNRRRCLMPILLFGKISKIITS